MAEPPLTVAPVGGYAAAVVAEILDQVLPLRLAHLTRQADAGRIHPEYLRELRLSWLAVRQAADMWLTHSAAVNGSTAGVVAAIAPQSTEIDTEAAAVLLRVTPNRVRQLVRSRRLVARRAGRVWMVDRRSVELYREEAAGVVRRRLGSVE
jgi:hypothetical protein